MGWLRVFGDEFVLLELLFESLLILHRGKSELSSSDLLGTNLYAVQRDGFWLPQDTGPPWGPRVANFQTKSLLK